MTPIHIRRVSVPPGNPPWMVTVRTAKGHGISAAYETHALAMAGVTELQAIIDAPARMRTVEREGWV